MIRFFVILSFLFLSCQTPKNVGKEKCVPINTEVQANYGSDLILRTAAFPNRGLLKYRQFFSDEGRVFQSELSQKNILYIYGQDVEDAAEIVFRDSTMVHKISLSPTVGLKSLSKNLHLILSETTLFLVNAKGELLKEKDFSSEYKGLFFGGIYGPYMAYNKEFNALYFFNDMRRTGYNLDLCQLSIPDLEITDLGIKAPNAKLNYGFYSMPYLTAAKNEIIVSYPYDEILYAYNYTTLQKRNICAGSNYFEPMTVPAKGWNNTERMDHKFSEPFFSPLLYVEKSNKYVRFYFKRKNLFESCLNQAYRINGRQASIVEYDSLLSPLKEFNLNDSVYSPQVFSGDNGVYYSQIYCNNTEYNADFHPFRFVKIAPK